VRRGQQHVKQAAIDLDHRGAEIAGGIDHCIDMRKRSDPSFGRRDVAGMRCCAEVGKFVRGSIRSGQPADAMSAAQKFANDGGADRTGTALNEHAHRCGLRDLKLRRPR
jgi:hypothetical protein